MFDSEENDGVKEDGSRILPILALNEVFIGESLSSRVSYLELQVSISNTNIRTSKFAFDATLFTLRWINNSRLKPETVDSASPLELVGTILIDPKYLRKRRIDCLSRTNDYLNQKPKRSFKTKDSFIEMGNTFYHQ